MHEFSKKDLEEGRALLSEKRLLSLVFSGGTYQAEVLASLKPKETVWPFLQMDDTGKVSDAFCSCDAAEKKGSCAHLAAAFLKISNGDPLHIRFRDSFWNFIGKACARRQGYSVKNLKENQGGYEIFSEEGKRLFWIKAKKGKAQNELDRTLFERPLETEETSLKFSNIPEEEIVLWREGRPSSELKYELSFWSDLSKGWFLMQEDGVSYELKFSDERLPHYLKVEFPDLQFEFAIARDMWPELIPTLTTVNSPLEVHSYSAGRLKSIRFLPDQGGFALHFEKEEEHLDLPSDIDGAEIVGQWLFLPKKGFYPKVMDPLLEKDFIPKKEVSVFLQRHLKLAKQHLKGEEIHPEPISLSYELSFDRNFSLCLEAYLFKKNDLTEPGAHYFGQWVYLPEKGFFQLKDQLFEGVFQKVPKEKVSDFVNRHRVWLQNYEGFQTHVSGVESHLGYRFDEEGKLLFFTRLEFNEETERVVDLGEWIYVDGKGFYAKVTARPGAIVKPGMEIEAFEISSFINRHREELDTIPGFFSYTCPLEKSGLNISLNKEGRIQINPEFFFRAGYIPEKVSIFGDYTFVEGEGFSEIPLEQRLPESYKVEKTIDPMAESYFVGYELDLLYPHVLTIDPQLKRPEKIALRMQLLKRQPLAKTGNWVLQIVYETEIGTVSPYTLWEAMWRGQQYLFTDAGLLFLRQKRFDWLRMQGKKRWLQKGTSLRMTTLDFLRLCGVEELLEPAGDSKKEKETRKLLKDFLNFHPPTEIDLRGLQSDLRHYQKMGADWLWFLHSYGLSGLLCDEMGLGKTHQAMALMAGIKNSAGAKKRPKFLVVCPTSVIYHWEKLVQTFLPSIRAYVFHGIGRRFEAFTEDHYDLLVTSYGIVRTENKALSAFHFDLVIYDELQVAKNEKSLTNKALRKLDATMRLGLTGTPIENRLSELKALFDLVIPGYLPGTTAFREMFINPIEKYQDDKKRYTLSRLIRPFLLRRKKSEVLTELPEKIEEIAICDLSSEQHKIYHQIIAENRDALLNQLEDDTKPPPIAHIFSMLTKLKQVCDHPCLINKDFQNYKKYSSGKWDLFLELFDEVRDSGQKLVVFSQYLDMLNIMGKHLQEKNIHFAEIRGSTKNRKEEVERFQEDPKCEVFLGSLQAAGVGIDLIAASVVIHYDRWWNPAKENQATDRVHRMGQKRGVQVFKLITKNTIEEHIHHLIEKKLTLAKGVIGFDDHDQIKGLERKELIDLLRLLE